MFGHDAFEDIPDEFIRDSHGWVIGELVRYEDGSSTYEFYDSSRLCWWDGDDDLGPCDPIDDEDEDDAPWADDPFAPEYDADAEFGVAADEDAALADLMRRDAIELGLAPREHAA
jgi:hypothetical protein